MTIDRDVPHGHKFVPFAAEQSAHDKRTPEWQNDSFGAGSPIQYRVPSAWQLDQIEIPDRRDTRRGLLALAVISSVIGLICGCLLIRGVQQDHRDARDAAMPTRFDGSAQARLPGPTTGDNAQPQRSAARNALYYADFATATVCRNFVPKDSGVPQSARESYLQSLVNCLTEVNRGPLAKLGVKLTAPRLVSAEESKDTACREYAHADWGARYCPGDQTITYRSSSQGDDPTSDAVLIAHEFSHHIQYAAGILDESEAQVQAGADKNEMTRREELQATCMVGVAINAPWSPVRLPQTRQKAFLNNMEDSPSDWNATHGTGETQHRWTVSGMNNSSSPYSMCNTWSAPVQDVT